VSSTGKTWILLPYLTSGHACTLQQKQPLKPILIFLNSWGCQNLQTWKCFWETSRGFNKIWSRQLVLSRVTDCIDNRFEGISLWLLQFREKSSWCFLSTVGDYWKHWNSLKKNINKQTDRSRKAEQLALLESISQWLLCEWPHFIFYPQTW